MLLKEANEVYQDVGDLMLGKYVLTDNAWVAWRQGDLPKGRAILEEYLLSQRQALFKWAVIDTLAGLIEMNLAMGDYQTAQNYASENLEIRRATHNINEEAWGLYDLGKVTYALGNLETGCSQFEQALKIFRQLHNKVGISLVLNFLGLIAIHQGRLDEGAGWIEESRAVCETIVNNNDYCMIENLACLGRVTLQLGDVARAENIYHQSLERVRSNHDLPNLPARLEGCASVAMVQERFKDGVVLIGAASSQRKSMGMPLWLVEKPAYDKLVAAFLSTLGEAAYQQAWEKGAGLTSEQSVSFALGCMSTKIQ